MQNTSKIDNSLHRIEVDPCLAKREAGTRIEWSKNLAQRISPGSDIMRWSDVSLSLQPCQQSWLVAPSPRVEPISFMYRNNRDHEGLPESLGAQANRADQEYDEHRNGSGETQIQSEFRVCTTYRDWPQLHRLMIGSPITIIPATPDLTQRRQVADTRTQ